MLKKLFGWLADTRKKRHWVYVELRPDGQLTGGTWIDLNLVEQVDPIFAKNPDDPDDYYFAQQVKILYSAVLKPLTVFNYPEYGCMSAQWFYNYWREYLKKSGEFSAKAEMPRARPGLLHSTKQTPHIIQNTGDFSLQP